MAVASPPKKKVAKRKRPRKSSKAPLSHENPPKQVLVIDVGGTKVKLLASGQTEPRKVGSGKRLTPSRMVDAVREMAHDWEFDAISIGYPGLVGDHGPQSEPGNLAPGWVGFDFASAFGKPVRIINDAAMQALGSYDGGRMLFLGLGTGLGSSLIANNVIVSMELGCLPSPEGRTLGESLGRKGLLRLGKRTWRQIVSQTVEQLSAAFTADYVVLGGGNAKDLRALPAGTRLGHNLTAFRGGFRLWNLEDVQTLSPEVNVPTPPAQTVSEWRVL